MNPDSLAEAAQELASLRNALTDLVDCLAFSVDGEEQAGQEGLAQGLAGPLPVNYRAGSKSAASRATPERSRAQASSMLSMGLTLVPRPEPA